MRFAIPGAALAAAMLAACGENGDYAEPFEGSVNLELQAHTEEFRPEVIEVTEGVHVAVGFALANSILIEGEDGVIIVDTTESGEAAEEVLAEFRRITGKPVKAVIYTHNHADHIFGARVFTGGDPSIPVYAHETTERHIDRFVNLLNGAISVRSARMFGTWLPPGGVENAGIGPFLRFDNANMALVRPTHTFSDRLEVEIAGVKLVLVHAPGETDDQLFVWLPEKRVLLPADNFYRAFPNLYTIRGTPYRDVREWVASLDRMRALEPEFLVPSHSRPLSGREKVTEALTHYRDAIQFVHDQTVRAMNKGMTPDEAVAFVKLPDHLANYPWLRPFYGRVAWSVRNIFNGYLGWFSGDAVDLNPLPPKERARRYARAFKAAAPLEQQARAALDDGDYQWAAELATHMTHAGDRTAGRRLKAEAFTAMAERTVNANGRNYYLSQAGELRGDFKITQQPRAVIPDSFIDDLPVGNIMSVMPVRLKAEETLDMEKTAVFRFPDVGEAYTIHIRRGVAEFSEGAADGAGIAITADSTVWKDIVFRKRTFQAAVASGDVKLEGGTLAAVNFLQLFEQG
ncbi:MAG: alkyl sulfatase dimerization domain-containing protein [Alphaproteobacteria bacterium]